MPRTALAKAPVPPGDYLYYARDRVLERIHLAPLGQAVLYTSRCPDKLGENEDAAAILQVDDERLVLAVCDGVGGQPDAQAASALALECLQGSVAGSRVADHPLREAILSGFDDANDAVVDLASGAATTMAVVEVEGRIVRSYHVGDSGVLVFGGRGKLKLQSIFHSPVGYALEAGVLDEQDAIEHEDRHLISNVIGDPGMHVGMSSPVALRPRDTVVIASDGLFDNMYTEEIIECLRRGALTDAVQTLADECHARMADPVEGRPSKPDDLTVLAFRAG
jgi:serine/threonine protein phosphatase PrpC